MRWLKFLLLAIGVGLLIYIVSSVNIEETIKLLQKIGMGMGLILCLYFLAFLIDTFTWQLTLKDIPLTAAWTYRFFQMRLAGEAFNNLTPLAGMGGEPLKAILLNKYYSVSYRDGIASVIIAKTINVLALILFLAIGFLFVLNSTDLNIRYKSIAGVGLITFSTAVVLFYLFQRLKITSATSNLLPKHKLPAWMRSALMRIVELEDHLASFYKKQLIRFSWALFFALGNWVLGALEIFYIMRFLDHPISLPDAWIIEAMTQLVRAGTFFIPASIGAQEGAFVIIGGAISGSPSAGLAAGVIRRIREIIWIGWGVLVFYILKPDLALVDAPNTKMPKKE